MADGGNTFEADLPKDVEEAEDEDAAEGVAARVAAERGLIETTLGALREELGYKKLGRWVLEELDGHLTGQKLGFIPTWKLRSAINTEPRKEQRVWVYALDGSTRAQVLTAILQLEDHDVFAALDGLCPAVTRRCSRSGSSTSSGRSPTPDRVTTGRPLWPCPRWPARPLWERHR
ncbi:hypothetical protein [Streptomyces sp. NPDC051994]|uniref:hypothetical protein n=1 Tax=unclassified Streptomyces TaxID=2593676 RepID=UPI0034233EAD